MGNPDTGAVLRRDVLERLAGLDRPLRIGLSGSGFVARGLLQLLGTLPGQYTISAVCSRRPASSLEGLGDGFYITDSPLELAETSDLVIECSGKVAAGLQVLQAAVSADKPVLTMNAELQQTIGFAFNGSGLVFEAQGDQPGSIATLAAEVVSMGFKPLVYGSQKGFFDPDPSPASMADWAQRQGISLSAVTSFTDGTKVQIEHALVANALGASIAAPGMVGPRVSELAEGASILADCASRLGSPVSDYVLQPGGKGEVFIVATHDAPPETLAYYKLGQGPFYLLVRPYHLGHLEIPLSIDRLISGRGLLQAPATMSWSVAAIAKTDLEPGDRIDRGVGSFEVRGQAISIKDHPEHLPIGLIENAVVARNIRRGQVIAFDDLELPDDCPVSLWQAGLRLA